MNGAREVTPHERRPHLTALACTLGIVLISRLAYWPDGLLGKDGSAYVNALKLDETFNVPMPGNIGWVLLARFFTMFTDPVNAFTLTAISVSLVGVVFLYLLCAMFLRPWMAAATTIAAALSPLVWYHSVPAASYETWIAVPPAIAYFGLRYAHERRLGLLYAAAAATGIGTILRPDMVAFAGPLLAGFLIVSRAPIVRGWAACGMICAICCLFWLLFTAEILGGVGVYVERVRAQSELIRTYSMARKGLLDGLVRNGGKYVIFYLLGAMFVTPLAAAGLAKLLRHWRSNAGVLLLGALALAPSMYFGTVLFMGNAGLVLPAVVVAFILGGWWLQAQFPAHSRRPVMLMGIVGALGAAQFVFVPMLPATNQRNVILNSLLLGYSGSSIRRMYQYNPAEFGIDTSVRNAVRQIRNPEPIPYFPPGFDGY